MRKPDNLIAAKNWHMQYIAERMRPDEITHWKAVSGSDRYDPEVAASGFISTPGVKFAVLNKDGTPAAVIGTFEGLPGVWTGWMIGTMDGWSSEWRSLTRATRWLIDEWMQAGAKVVRICTIEERAQAMDWYERGLLMKYEGVHRCSGAQGQNIVFFSRTQGDPNGR
jgi:hypothetical protein